MFQPGDQVTPKREKQRFIRDILRSHLGVSWEISMKPFWHVRSCTSNNLIFYEVPGNWTPKNFETFSSTVLDITSYIQTGAWKCTTGS